jgi:hypothetical protein
MIALPSVVFGSALQHSLTAAIVRFYFFLLSHFILHSQSEIVRTPTVVVPQRQLSPEKVTTRYLPVKEIKVSRDQNL